MTSTFLSLFATCLLFGLSGWGAVVLTLLLPAASFGLLRRCGRLAGCGGSADGPAPGRRPGQRGWPRCGVGMYVAILWCALTFAKGAASSEVDARSFSEAFFWPFLISALASLACMVCYMHFARRISLLSVSRATLPLMCASLMGIVVLPRSLYPAAFAAASVAATMFDTFLWIRCSGLVRHGMGDVTGIVGRTRAFVQLGAVAVVPMNVLAPAMGGEVFAGCLVCVLVAAFACALPGLIGDESACTGESGAAAPDSGDVPPHGVLDGVAAAYGLSARERDVFYLLARGRDLPYIRDELGISRNTVGTHIRHVYQKTGVHSKQELLDLVEDAARYVR